MKKSSLLFLGLFAISPAVADVASTANVEAMRADVQTKIDALANNSGYTAGRVLQTDSNGNVVAGLLKTDMIADGAIQTMHIADGEVTNADLADGLELDKLDWGTLPTDGNMYIPIWNSATNEYVFELYEDGLLHCKAPSYDVGAEKCVNANTTPVKMDTYTKGGFASFGICGSVYRGYCIKAIYSDDITVKVACDGGETKPKGELSMVEDIRQATCNGDGCPSCWCKVDIPGAAWVAVGRDIKGACEAEEYLKDVEYRTMVYSAAKRGTISN